MSHALINILQSQPHHIISQSFDKNIITLNQLSTFIITFDLILLSCLNFVQLPFLDLFEINMSKLTALIQLKIEKQLDYVKIKYQTTLQVLSEQNEFFFINKTQIQIDKYIYEQTGIQKATIKFHLTEKYKNQLKTEQKLNLNVKFGRKKQQDKFGRFSISNFKFKLQSQHKNHLRTNNVISESITQQQQKQMEMLRRVENYDMSQGSFPIIYSKNVTNLKLLGEQFFIDLLQQLPPYSAINTTNKAAKLFICHDMKGGYKEQTNFINPYATLQKFGSYRFNYFWQTNIFNYFSHKTISIPPRHWRQLCKRYQVKCLGTFIVEPQKIDEEFYLTNQFAYRLVFFAKKYRFDGYLINIQNQVKNIQRLQQWLGKLTSLIHEYIPGSEITWYDSVSTSGFIDYQNQLNQKNIQFYHLSDSFYTNYWWNQQQIKDDLRNNNQNKIIYVGNDVWGRGTYGGGQYNLYKAIDEIEKQNDEKLGMALFAPAYTYENGGENDPFVFKLNEDKLYRGVSYEQYKLQNWQTLNTNKNLKIQQSLNAQQNQPGKVSKTLLNNYSQQKLIRMTFSYQMNSSLPRFDQSQSNLEHKILIKLIGLTSEQLYHQELKFQQNPSSHNKLSFLLKTDQINQQLIFQTKIFSNPPHNIDINYQTAIVYVQYYIKQNDWIEEVPRAGSVQIGQYYNTFFNVGYGDVFYFQGTPIYEKYDFMADYDLPITLSINHPLQTDLQYHDAYIGGSSLLVQQGVLKLLNIQLFGYVKNNYQKPENNYYMLKIVHKHGVVSSVGISQSNGNNNGYYMQFEKISQKDLKNGWKESRYLLSSKNLEEITSNFNKEIQSWIFLSVQSKILLGQVTLSPLQYQQTQPITQTPIISHQKPQQIQLSISQSYKSSQPTQIHLNIYLNIISPSNVQYPSQRLILLIKGVYCGFVYFTNQNNSNNLDKLNQIIIKEQQTNDIVILTEDGNIIIQFSNVQLFKLKRKQLGYRIYLRNY